MNRLLIATALASTTLVAGMAHAENTGPYITIEGGAVKNERTDFRSTANNFEHSDHFKTGWEAGGALGYDFGHFRVEAEGFYHETQIKNQFRPGGSPSPRGYFDGGDGLQGRTNSAAAMANALVGLGHWGGVKLYAGAGIGYADTFVRDYLPTAGLIQGHATGLAWQALGGLTIPISHNLDFGIKYRYFRPDGGENFAFSDGSVRHASLRSHSALATLTYNFGRAEEAAVVEEPVAAPPPPPPAPMAPPPPPPPPPAPLAVACNKGPYILFFDWDRSDISVEAASILDSAIQAYGNCGSVAIMLAGFADSSGKPHYNVGLSARRADAAQGYLINHGIAAGLIGTHAYGETNQRVATADGVRELQNRRVEITYGPGSGN